MPPGAARLEYPWFVCGRCARRAWRESIVSVASAQYGSFASIRSMVLLGVTSRFRETFVKLHRTGVCERLRFLCRNRPLKLFTLPINCVVNVV